MFGEYTLHTIAITGVAQFDYFFTLGCAFGLVMFPCYAIMAILSRS